VPRSAGARSPWELGIGTWNLIPWELGVGSWKLIPWELFPWELGVGDWELIPWELFPWELGVGDWELIPWELFPWELGVGSWKLIPWESFPWELGVGDWELIPWELEVGGWKLSYFPMRWGASVLFSRQTKSSSSVFGAMNSLSVTVHGAVYAFGSFTVTCTSIRP